MTTAALESAFEGCRRHLWGLCYRMTGCAADADDLVQETFVRAIEKPPPRTDMPWRPWLVRVAMNLARDHLRWRTRRGYHGPWLPSPVEPAAVELEDGAMGTAGRYDLLESVSIAFLVALEELSPQQRAVLLLRDVFDYSVAETAEAVDLSQANVKTTLHRARKKMAGYDERRCPPSEQTCARTRDVMQAMLERLTAGDAEGFAELLAEDVRALSDGGGEFHAAGKPVLGRDRVAKFLFGLVKLRGLPSRSDVRMLGGLPALVSEFDGEQHEHWASRAVLAIQLDADGRIREIYNVLASRKLTGVDFGA